MPEHCKVCAHPCSDYVSVYIYTEEYERPKITRCLTRALQGVFASNSLLHQAEILYKGQILGSGILLSMIVESS